MTDNATMAKPEMQVIRVTDWKEVTAQVAAAGGRVVRMLDQSILVVELPPQATPASVGAEQILERKLSPSSRKVTSRWRAVSA